MQFNQTAGENLNEDTDSVKSTQSVPSIDFEIKEPHSDTPVLKSALKSSVLKKAQSSEQLSVGSQSLKPVNQTVSNGKKKVFTPLTDKCTRCKTSVYAAEKVLGGKLIFHSICFKCADCKKVLNLTNYFEHNNEIYCKRKFIFKCFSQFKILK